MVCLCFEMKMKIPDQINRSNCEHPNKKWNDKKKNLACILYCSNNNNKQCPSPDFCLSAAFINCYGF